MWKKIAKRYPAAEKRLGNQKAAATPTDVAIAGRPLRRTTTGKPSPLEVVLVGLAAEVPQAERKEKDVICAFFIPNSHEMDQSHEDATDVVS